jgi:pimeloyl-ACP methyl ester carboxylesterase
MPLSVLAAIFSAVLAALFVGGLIYGAVYTAQVEARFPPSGRMIETSAGPLHVIEAGAAEGPALVLVHGASANALELLSGLEGPLTAAGYRVIAFDRPGFGASPNFSSSEFSSRDRLAGHAAAAAALIDALELEDPVVIGHSYGGAVVLRLALDYPDAAGGLVLLGPATHGDVGPVAWYNHVGATPVLGWAFSRTIIPIAGPGAAAGGVESSFAPAPVPEGHLEATGVGLVFRPRTFAANATDLARVNPELLIQQERYGEIAIPVAIISGEGDETVSTQGHSVRATAAIEGARLEILPDVGHMPHHAAPALIVEQIEAIFESMDAEVVARAAPGTAS